MSGNLFYKFQNYSNFPWYDFSLLEGLQIQIRMQEFMMVYPVSQMKNQLIIELNIQGFFQMKKQGQLRILERIVHPFFQMKKQG